MVVGDKMEEGHEGEIFEKFRHLFMKYKDEEEKKESTENDFIWNIENNLKKVKIFHIDEKQKHFFITGKVKVEKDMDIKLPFNEIFLDVSFTREELAKYGIKINCDELMGLIISKGYVYSVKNRNEIKMTDIPTKSVGENIRLSFLSNTVIKKNGIYMNDIYFGTYSKNIKFHKDFDYLDERNIIDKNDCEYKKVQDFWYKFLINVIKFVNYPDVILKEHKRTEANIKRRIKKGKCSVPEFIIVKLNGELQRYVDNVYEKPKRKWHYNYSFDVKGHPRKLTSPRYKKAKEIWIKPYVKGEGRKVESMYKIEKKK